MKPLFPKHLKGDSFFKNRFFIFYTIFSEISSEDKFVIAFSGGADSRYLLEKILEQCAEKKIHKKNIILAHFNHHIRDDRTIENIKNQISEAERDENFSREISEKFGLTYEVGHWNHQDNTAIKISENSARNARYKFLENIRQKYSAKYILTAHHKDDQAETVFLQFIRGGGVNALTGMKKVLESRKIYRPLLQISKQEILEYLHQKNIFFCEDSTNKESIFTRNFIRNEVFPLINQKFPNFSSRLAEKSEYFQTLQNEFEDSAQKFLAENNFEKGVVRKDFLTLATPIQFEVVKSLIYPVFCDQKKFSEISGFIKESQSGKKFSLKSATFEVFGENVFFYIDTNDSIL